MRRSDHYVEAERLTDLADELITAASSDNFPALRTADREAARLYLQAALVHATLAAAGPGVEQEVIDQAKRDKPSQAERQAARPPLDGRPKPHPPIQRERA